MPLQNECFMTVTLEEQTKIFNIHPHVVTCTPEVRMGLFCLDLLCLRLRGFQFEVCVSSLQI